MVVSTSIDRTNVSTLFSSNSIDHLRYDRNIFKFFIVFMKKFKKMPRSYFSSIISRVFKMSN